MGDMNDDLREVMGLLPCPFCGGEARLNDVTPYFWTVNCTGCETEGPPFPSSDESVSAWNTRPALLARQEGEDARDAARYRWLRSDSADLGPLFSAGSGGSMEMHSGEELDDAIDAARSGGGD